MHSNGTYYSDHQKIAEYDDDFKTLVMILNGPIWNKIVLFTWFFTSDNEF